MNFKPTEGITNYNTALQGNTIALTFPKAVDKTNYDKRVEAITYQYRYHLKPLQLETSEIPLVVATDPIVTTTWKVLTGVKDTQDKDLVEAEVRLPQQKYDYQITYEIRALDDHLDTPMDTTQQLSLYGIYNSSAQIFIDAMNWIGKEDIEVKYSIRDLGFGRPYNIDKLHREEYAGAWSQYKKDLIRVFGNIRLTVKYKYDKTSYITHDNTQTGDSFEFADFDLANPRRSFLVDNTDNKLNPDNRYYFEFEIIKDNIKTGINTVLDNSTNQKAYRFTLSEAANTFKIKRGAVQTNFPREKNAPTTGGAMFSRSSHNASKDGIVEDGHSVSVYDHHVPTGDVRPANEPSIGFMRTDHSEIGRLKRQNVGGGEYISLLQGDTTPITFRGNRNLIEYWDVGLDMWQTVLPSKVTKDMNGDIQWDFSNPENIGIKLGDSMSYSTEHGLHIGAGAIGIDSLSDEIKEQFKPKGISVSADRAGILYNAATGKVDPEGQVITLNAKTPTDTGTVKWTIIGVREDKSGVTLEPSTIKDKGRIVTINGKLIEPYAFITFYAELGEDRSETINVLKISHGIDYTEMKGIDKITTWFLATDKKTGVTYEDIGFTETEPDLSRDKPYLWMYMVTTYSDNSPPTKTKPMLIGRYSQDGKHAYEVRILSSNGEIFKDNDVQTTLKAYIFQGDVEITDRIDSGQFKWERISADPTDDVRWNKLPKTIGKKLQITAEDITTRATFNCYIKI